MSIEITESFTIQLPNVFEQLEEAITEAQSDHKKLIIELAAIHEGLTGNYNFYPAQVLKEALQTWITPYPKPILTNHDIQNARPLGRVMAARMDADENNVPFIRLQVGITDSNAIQMIKDKRYLTGSVGATASSASCSICEVDLAKQACRHIRGKVYNGKLAYRKVNDLKFHEYSFVNVPGDSKSIILNASDDIKESLDDSEWIQSARIFALDMDTQNIVEFVESKEPVNILESMSKKNAHMTYNNLKGTWLSVSAFDYVEENDDFVTNKNSENVTHSIIDNTINTEGVDNSANRHVLETENVNVEENKMDDVLEAEEDLLDVVEQLSDDLASNASDEVTEQEEVTESEETDNTDDNTNMVEESEAEADESAVEEADGSEAEVTEGEPESEISEGEEETDEQLAENQSDEQAELDSTVTEGEEQEVDVNAVVNENQKLKEENTRLRAIVHKTLAERVVDAKIDRGLLESADRAGAIEEHVARSASSLADSLKDLYAMPKVTTVSEGLGTFEMSDKSVSTDTSDRVLDTNESAPVELDAKAKEEQVINFFTDRLLDKHKKL